MIRRSTIGLAVLALGFPRHWNRRNRVRDATPSLRYLSPGDLKEIGLDVLGLRKCHGEIWHVPIFDSHSELNQQ